MLKKSNKLFVALGYLISLVMGMQTAGYQYIIISMRDEFALSNAGMAVLGSVQSVVGLLMSFVFSRFIDKVDKRKLMFIGGAIYILGCLCNGFSSGAGMTIAALVIAGVGGNVLSTALYPALTSTDPQNSSMYTNMLQVFYGGGAMIAPMALSVFMGSGGMNWRGHYLIISASMLLMLALSSLVRPETSMRLERMVQVSQQAERPNFAKIYQTAAFWLLSLSIGFYMCMETGLMNYARHYFEAMDDPKSAGLAISVAWGLMLPTRFIASKMKRHKGKMVCLSFLFAGLAMLLMAVLRIPGFRCSGARFSGCLRAPAGRPSSPSAWIPSRANPARPIRSSALAAALEPCWATWPWARWWIWRASETLSIWWRPLRRPGWRRAISASAPPIGRESGMTR